MNEIILIISLPILFGVVLFLFPEKVKLIKGIIALVVSTITLYWSFVIFNGHTGIYSLKEAITAINFDSILSGSFSDISKYISFNIDNLCKLVIVFINIFGFLILLYSIVYIDKKKKIRNYYSFFLITLGLSSGTVLVNNLLLLLIFWGILGFTLYMLIKGHDEESSSTAKKTLIIVGASDGIMILGVAIIWKITGTLEIDKICINTTSALTITAFITLLIGSFTKAGAFPFHSWIPDYAKDAPASSSAYLPASLDKLLGIYLLFRICNNLFIPNQWLTLLILCLGVITIITAVMMALVQHNYKRLLGFHAVSQVGYMIVGLGLGSMIGIAAGLFHMVNNALYKSGLFLSAGSVEYRTGKNRIEEVGGLSKTMPITFICALVFALSISGIPPFNGFASKWMIYQGIIDFGAGSGVANQLWIIWLGLAILGSALTLASFIKFIGGTFLGRQKQEFKKVKEIPVTMWLPLTILALFCIGFGVFATNYIVPKLFMPITGSFKFVGIWQSTNVSILILVSIILGIFIYLIGNIKNFRTDDSFIGGGEKMQEESHYSTGEFYNTIKGMGFLSTMYKKAEERWFDIYDFKNKIIIWISKIFSDAHTGILPRYSFWVFAGLIIMLLLLI